jgi:hypothetical protein
MINIKKQDPVADAVRDILQQEALKGNQHKIDKNKNNKIDAHDFKILRGEKKSVKEDSVEETNNPFDWKNYKSQLPTKPGEKAGFDSKKISTGTFYSRKPVKDEPMKKEEVEQIDELKKSTVRSYMNKKVDRIHKDADLQYPFKAKPISKKEVEKNTKDLMRGHARLSGVKPTSEEVEQIDELSKSTLGSYVKNAARDVGASRSLGADFKNKAEKSRKPNIKAASSRLSDRFNAVAQKRHAGIGKAVERLTKEEIEQVDERTLSTRETAEKERIVKGMKKNLAGFKARYGERAKSVMYATATKNAMKEEALEEGKRPEGDTVPFVQNANTSSSPMKKIKEVAGAAMKKISKDLKTK